MTELLARYSEHCAAEGKLASIGFELTNTCNFNCVHCYRVHGEQHLSEEVFRTALDEAESLGALLVGFNGGEPTLHPRFIEFALEVVRRGMHLSVLTNASGMTPRVIAALARWSPGIHLQVSLYGTEAASGADITGVADAFDSTFERIIDLQHHGFDVRVSLLVSSRTADSLESLIARLNRHQIRIGLMPQMMATESGSRHPLELAANDAQLMRLFNFEGEWKADPQDPSLEMTSLSAKHACNAGRTTLGVRVDGSILPCLVLTNPVLGHFPTDSLASVMEGMARSRFLESNVVPDTCRSCDLRRFCMRCPADAMFETGSLTGIPPESCRIARLRAKFHIDSPK